VINKITSTDDISEYLKSLNIDVCDIKNHLTHNTNWFNFYPDIKPNWWVYREQARILRQVYKVTDILKKLNNYFPVFAHISLDDPKMVAFTPDVNCGESDKQVRISIGKLLSKYLPVLSQKAIQDAITDHESELNPEILWASGEELTDIYENQMGGIGACMSKNHWTVHPTVAYHTDEIKLAYLKRGSNIVARTLVYEPKDKSKKVFIRMYPYGHALEKHLKDLGYEPGDFIGAKLNTVNLIDNKYAMPYLDGNNASGRADYSSIALIDNQITVLNQAQIKAINGLYPSNSYYTSSQTAEGTVTLKNVASKLFIQKCAISNKTYSLLTAKNTVAVFCNNKEGLALSSELPSTWLSGKALNSRILYAHPTNIFNVAGQLRISSVEELTDRGYKQLDKELYPNLSEHWFNTSCITTSGKNIKNSDAFFVYHYDGKKSVTHIYHSSEIKVKQFYKLACGNYCTKNSKYLVTTSGKKVLPNVNSFYTCIDNTYSIRRPKHSVVKYEQTFYNNDRDQLYSWIIENEYEIYKKYLIKATLWPTEKMARELLPYTNNRYGILQNVRRQTHLKTLSDIANEYAIESVQRRAIQHFIAEMQSIEY
jgi:hypothetical protein